MACTSPDAWAKVRVGMKRRSSPARIKRID
jgi:hypothetical protein